MGNETLTLAAQDTVNRAATRYLENAPSLDITEKGQRVFADETSNDTMKPTPKSNDRLPVSHDILPWLISFS